MYSFVFVPVDVIVHSEAFVTFICYQKQHLMPPKVNSCAVPISFISRTRWTWPNMYRLFAEFLNCVLCVVVGLFDVSYCSFLMYFAGVWNKCHGDCCQVVWSTNQVYESCLVY